jgi:hypothetical protein
LITADGASAPTPYEQWLIDNSLDPAVDTVMKDGRMVSPEEAYLLGDDPTDPNDVTRITKGLLLPDGETRRLHFQGLRNRVYRLEHTDDLRSETWTTEPTAVYGEDQPSHFDVPVPIEPGDSNRFYRIRISFPD